eukprot:GHVH01000921.1.p1 GENE.GHVH01000921.1~~GHVH01000921.1.p1  ORF type:complete len:354 (+),score=60.19 GHVH01000921.1:133-1194(+)
MATKNELPWVEKYRPKTLDDVLGHRDVLNILKGFVNTGSLPHILLHGPPGTGKTTIVKALAHSVYGSRASSMVLELNASDDRGIDTVRNVIKTFASTSKVSSVMGDDDINIEFKNSPMSQLKLIVLDEADQMTSAAQMALRRIIELHSDTVRFFIICNYMNRINAALQSRCTKFRMPPLRKLSVKDRIREVAQLEGMVVSERGMDSLIKLSNGDMRKMMNLMEAGNMIGIQIDEIDESLGYPTDIIIEDLKGALLEETFSVAHEKLTAVKRSKGYRLYDILEGLYESTVQDDWPVMFIGVLIPRLASIQNSLNDGADEDLQLCALVAAYTEARFALFKADEYSASKTTAKDVK